MHGQLPSMIVVFSDYAKVSISLHVNLDTELSNVIDSIALSSVLPRDWSMVKGRWVSLQNGLLYRRHPRLGETSLRLLNSFLNEDILLEM